MYSYYIQKSRPYHVRICTLIPLCHTLNPFLLGTEQDNVIFLCGKQGKTINSKGCPKGKARGTS